MIGRRQMLKSMAGIPVLGLMGFEWFRKLKFDRDHDSQSEILNELGIRDIQSYIRPVLSSSGGDLIRIGIVGFGVRGTQLAKALGFMDAKAYKSVGKEAGIVSQAKFGNLNVAITGICDVFDIHAEKGLSTAKNDIHSMGELARKYPVKRYTHYHDMLADKNIDAVIITTPDHHHAQMTIDAIKAGKHVYCEKSLIRREEEIFRVYDVVKNSNYVFQLGHQITQNAVYQQAKELISQDILGKISHIETTTSRNTPEGAWIRHLDALGNPKPGNERTIDWKQWLGSSPYVPFSIERYYGWARFFAYDTGLFGQLFSHEFDAVNQLMNVGIPESVTVEGGQYNYKDFGEIPDVLNCTFNFPQKEFILTYNANLASSKSRPRTIYGKDALLTIGKNLDITPDGKSEKYAEMIDKGLIDPSYPMLSIFKGSQSSGGLDAVSSATTKYYASRGLTSTYINGREWDVTHLHIKEWINCIRNGGETSANIDKAFEEGVTIAMADIAYRENCRTEWDPLAQRIKRC